MQLLGNILKATSKSTDIIVFESIEDLAHAQLFADFSISKQKIQNANNLKDTGIYIYIYIHIYICIYIYNIYIIYIYNIYKNFCSDTMGLPKLLLIEKVLEHCRQGTYACLNLNYRTTFNIVLLFLLK